MDEEKRREYRRKYWSNPVNRERRNRLRRERYRENPAAFDKWIRPYCKKNQARYRARHKERIAQAGRAYYIKNKERILAFNNAKREMARAEFRVFVNGLKANPCMDCGRKYSSWVMHFDHRVPSEKQYSISDLMRRATNMDRLKQEIEKCDLVCANCHAERTHRQQQNGQITLFGRKRVEA